MKTAIVFREVTKLLILALFVIGLIFVISELIPTVSGSSTYPPPGYGPTSEEQSTNLTYPPQETTISTPLPPSPTPKVKFKGAECFIDPYNGITLWLPTGWFGHIANSQYGGASKIFNYDPSNIQYDHGAPINLPDSHIDVQITSLKLEAGQTLEQWVAKTIEDKNSAQKIDNLNGTAGQYSSYTIGNYDGFSYSITDSAGWNAQMITFEANGRIIILNIFPANSPDFPAAIEILNTLDASGAYSCSTTFVSDTKSTDLFESTIFFSTDDSC